MTMPCKLSQDFFWGKLEFMFQKLVYGTLPIISVMGILYMCNTILEPLN